MNRMKNGDVYNAYKWSDTIFIRYLEPTLNKDEAVYHFTIKCIEVNNANPTIAFKEEICLLPLKMLTN